MLDHIRESVIQISQHGLQCDYYSWPHTMRARIALHRCFPIISFMFDNINPGNPLLICNWGSWQGFPHQCGFAIIWTAVYEWSEYELIANSGWWSEVDQMVSEWTKPERYQSQKSLSYLVENYTDMFTMNAHLQNPMSTLLTWQLSILVYFSLTFFVQLVCTFSSEGQLHPPPIIYLFSCDTKQQCLHLLD